VGNAVKDSRVPYVLILFLFSLAAAILRYSNGLRLNYIVNIDVCIDPNKCYGVGAVYRVTFGAFLFFIFHALLLTSRSCVKRGADTGFWILKLLLLAGLVVVSFVLPPAVFDVYFWVAMVVAGFFIIVQIIILIDFAYSWNDDWLKEEKDWKAAILTCATLGYILSLVAMVLMFIYLASGPQCSLEQAFISITIILTLIFTIISSTNQCEHGAILPSAVCTVFCYWLLYSALTDNPSTCNTFRGSPNTFRTIMGFIVAAGSVAYAAFNASQNSHALTLTAKAADRPNSNDTSAPIKYHDTEEEEHDASLEQHEESEEALGAQTKEAWRFQLTMASGACYACMLLTDWGEAAAGDSGPGMTSVWIQIVSQWTAALLYTWTLVAPYVLTNREF